MGNDVSHHPICEEYDHQPTPPTPDIEHNVACIVRYFHRTSCYPEATEHEVQGAVNAIMKLFNNQGT